MRTGDHDHEPTERPARAPHGAALALVVGALLVAGCGGGPRASVGVTPVGDGYEVRAKACDGGGLEEVEVVDPGRPGDPLWRARRDGGPAVARLRLGRAPEGYEASGALPDPGPGATWRVVAVGPDGAVWGGPRLRPAELAAGTIRVAGQDVDLDEWAAEPARCPRVGLAGAVLAGGATAAVAAGLWLVVRALARAARRDR